MEEHSNKWILWVLGAIVAAVATILGIKVYKNLKTRAEEEAKKVEK